MALYTAAAMHDYDHPGKTNAFLVAADDSKVCTRPHFEQLLFKEIAYTISNGQDDANLLNSKEELCSGFFFFFVRLSVLFQRQYCTMAIE